MKTSESIEASEERKKQNKELIPLTPADCKRYGRGRRPNSHTPRGWSDRNNPKSVSPNRWKPGQSGNPSGRLSAEKDIARQIARAVFENNREQLYEAFAKAALKGNAYAFSQLADRAYGKLKERVEYDVSEYRDWSDEALVERLHQLEKQLGMVRDNQMIVAHPISTTVQ